MVTDRPKGRKAATGRETRLPEGLWDRTGPALALSETFESCCRVAPPLGHRLLLLRQHYQVAGASVVVIWLRCCVDVAYRPLAGFHSLFSLLLLVAGWLGVAIFEELVTATLTQAITGPLRRLRRQEKEAQVGKSNALKTIIFSFSLILSLCDS